MVGVTTARGILLKDDTIRKLENHWSTLTYSTAKPESLAQLFHHTIHMCGHCSMQVPM